MMKKLPSYSGSQIITAFTQANHEIMLQEAKQHLDQITLQLNERRKKLLQTIGVKKSTEPIDASKSEKFKTMDEHSISFQELSQKLNTDLNKGLSKEEADRRFRKIFTLNSNFIRLLEDGKNMLSEKKGEPWYWKLIHELTTMFAMLLWVGSGLCFLAYGLFPEDPSNVY